MEVGGAILSLDEIFNRIITSKIFKSREKLRPDYVPEELPHREGEILKLGSILAPVLRGERPSNVLIFGLPGTGKTAVTRYVLSKLVERAQNINLPFSYTYINCRKTDTPYQVLSEVAKAVGVKVPFTGLSTAEVYRRLFRGLEAKTNNLLIVLDEMDNLISRHGDDVLYKLLRINEETVKGKISIIGIANDLRLTEKLDPRVKSSLGEEEIVFPPYDAIQLRDILKNRAKEAFNDGVIEDGVIELCAAFAAKEHGDARRALDLLRVSGEIAEREGSSKVTENHVRIARAEIEKNRVIEVLKTMPLHVKLVFTSIYIAEKLRKIVTTGEVYRVYENLCKVVGVEPLTSRRVSDILNELDMLGVLSAEVVSLGRHGRTKIIKSRVPKTIIVEALSSDVRVEKILASRIS